MLFDETAFKGVCRTLKNADPVAYDRLVDHLQQHVAVVTVAVTDAPPDRILVLQGQAQEARKLFQLFSEIRERV